MILPRRLRLAPLLLAFLLTVPPLTAATHGHRPSEARQPRLSMAGLLSEAWALVSGIVAQAVGSADPLEKSGSSSDPFGNPKPDAQPPAAGTSATIQRPSGN